MLIYDEHWFKVVFIREQEAKLRAEFDNVMEKSSEIILNLIKDDPKLSASKIADKLHITSRRIERHIAILKQSGNLKRIGADRGGSWKVIQ